MIDSLSEVFDEYPNPFYIVRPLIANGISEDFTYVYVNHAFCDFLNRKKEDLLDRKFSEAFSRMGERPWLDLFAQVVVEQKATYLDGISHVIGRRLFTQMFPVKPDLCACIITDSEAVWNFQQEAIELRKKANCDFLTGFYNRFYLKELTEDPKLQQGLGVTYLDINNLKRTNDTQGHAAGDQLIVKVARMLREFYESSMIFRMGGDEFVVLTPGQDQEGFFRLSREVQSIFDREDLVAMGYDYFPKVQDIRLCIENCDAKMYARKKYMKSLR
jgi:diguanylate cyclase (GGDEF)-like protein